MLLAMGGLMWGLNEVCLRCGGAEARQLSVPWVQAHGVASQGRTLLRLCPLLKDLALEATLG